MHPCDIIFFFFRFLRCLTLFLSALEAPSPSASASDSAAFSPGKQKHKLACLNSFALHSTCSIIIKMRSVTKEIWRLVMSRWMGVIAVNRPVNLAEASVGQQKAQTHASKQTNEPVQSLVPPPPSTLHLGCSAFVSFIFFFFFSPSFFVSSSPPICCVWTWPLGANSLPWTPSAVWLSTVNRAWLVVSGRDRGCAVTCSACRLLPPGIIFHRRRPGSRERERERGCDEKGCLSSINTFHSPGAPGQNLFSISFVYSTVHL